MEIGRFLARRAVIVVATGAPKRSTDNLASDCRLDSLKVLIRDWIKHMLSILVLSN
jgi:hypothetical protein